MGDIVMVQLTKCVAERIVVLVYTRFRSLSIGAGLPSGHLLASPSDCGLNTFTAIMVSTPSTNPGPARLVLEE